MARKRAAFPAMAGFEQRRSGSESAVPTSASTEFAECSVTWTSIGCNLKMRVIPRRRRWWRPERRRIDAATCEARATLRDPPITARSQTRWTREDGGQLAGDEALLLRCPLPCCHIAGHALSRPCRPSRWSIAFPLAACAVRVGGHMPCDLPRCGSGGG